MIKAIWNTGSAARLSLAFALSLCFPLAASTADPVRTPWNGERVGALASQLVDQVGAFEQVMRDQSAAAEAATEDPDREKGVGLRTVVIQDLGVLERRVGTYRTAIESGQGREQTRSLFGDVDSQMSLTAADVRRLPDFANHSDALAAMEKSVAALRGFYAEKIEVNTPPDPLKKLE